MKVKLLQITKDAIDVMWTAARTCYASKSPIDMWDNKYDIEPYCEISEEEYNKCQEKMWKLVQQVLGSGHSSIAENIHFTFAIEGISRACMAQLTRHRAGIVFAVQSQRYVEIKEDINYILKLKNNCINTNCTPTEEALKLLDKYFVNVDGTNCGAFLDSLIHYLGSIANGMKPEDARMFLPNATKTNITMSLNYRELMHICGLRLCNRAQAEIRNLFKAVVEEVRKVEPVLAEYLVPNCERDGFCREGKCCGRKPTLKQVMEVYNKFKDMEA